jgi:hypothetical protein
MPTLSTPLRSTSVERSAASGPPRCHEWSTIFMDTIAVYGEGEYVVVDTNSAGAS